MHHQLFKMGRYFNSIISVLVAMVPPDTLSTVGVDVGIWKYRKDLEGEQQRTKKRGVKPMRSVTFYTWDFGGQVRVCVWEYVCINVCSVV